MNDSTASMIIVMSLVILLVFFLVIEPAFAVKMELLNHTLSRPPVICPDGVHEYKWQLYKSVQLWNEFTADPKWEVSIGKHNCNIHIREVPIILEGDAWGQAVCNIDGCWIQLQKGSKVAEVKLRTLVHELGHAFSLGHYPEPENVKEALAIGTRTHSVMWFVGGDKILDFPQELLTALECRHYADGFGGVVNFHCKTLKWPLESIILTTPRG